MQVRERLERIGMRFTKPTVDSILSSFKKTVAQLRELESASYAEQEKRQQEAFTATELAKQAAEEARKANSVALKIESLIKE